MKKITYTMLLLTTLLLNACQKKSTQQTTTSTSTTTSTTTGGTSGTGGTGTNSSNNKVCTVCLIEKNGVQVAKSLAGSYAGTEADVSSWENEFKSNNQGIPNITPVCTRKTDYNKIVCTECYVINNSTAKKTSLMTFTSYENEVTQWEQTLTSNNAGIGTTVCKRKGYLKDNFCTECEAFYNGGSSLNAQYVGTQTELTTWEIDFENLNKGVPGVVTKCYRK